MSFNIAVYGKNGQLGSAFVENLGNNALFFAGREHDFSDYKILQDTLDSHNIDCLINATAYTQVDNAETNEAESHRVNAKIPQNLARYCADNNILLIHFSTDYVFGGNDKNPYKETDTTCPINIYGKTKLQGEINITKSGCKHLIFRTSWVFDNAKQNFLTTMLKLSKERRSLSIINDQIGAPTYADDLCKAVLEIIDQAKTITSFPSGIYHICNSGFTSWYEYALKIFKEARDNGLKLQIEDITPVASSEYKTIAKRPLNSRLNCDKVNSIFNIRLRPWQEAVKDAVSLIEDTK